MTLAPGRTEAKEVFVKYFPILIEQGPVSPSDLCWAYAKNDRSAYPKFQRMMSAMAEFLELPSPYCRVSSIADLPERVQRLRFFFGDYGS